MNRFYCPYCSPRYQFHKQRPDGAMVCGQCGDRLVKKPFIKATQVFAIIAATAFIAPSLFLLVSSLKNMNRLKPQTINKNMAISLTTGYSETRSH